MYISNEELEKIKEYVDNLYWDQDRMSRDGRYFLNKLDNYIKKLEKEKENNIYVITNNAVVDDEIDYSIYGVATDINEAKKIFNQAVKDAKTDSDFENLDEAEKFIIKNFEYDKPKEYVDESLYDEMCIHKDKYYQSKKSAYIKMALQLGMMEDMHIDSQLVTEFKKIIDSNIITISG